MKLKKIMPIIVLVLTIMITGCGREKVDYNQTSTDINRINLFDVELEKQKIDFNVRLSFIYSTPNYIFKLPNQIKRFKLQVICDWKHIYQNLHLVL